MKNFDPAAAKRGAKVCTMDGKPARILCFDSNMASDEYATPIVAEVAINGRMNIICYTAKGCLDVEGQSKYDLMMADDDYMEKLGRGEYGNSNIETPDWHGPHRIMTTEQIATQPFASISDENYWRRMYAGMAMQGILPRFNPASYCVCSNESEYEFVAVEAAKYADALIEALKKENKDDTH